MPEELAPDITEPVVDAPVEGDVIEPVVEDPWAGLDPAEARTAVEFHKNIQTEEGAMQSFFQLGRAFGFGVKEIEAWFSGAPNPTVPTAPAPAEPAPDELMTYSQFKEMMDRQLTPIQQGIQQQQQAAVEAQARSAVDSTIKELGVSDDATKAAILQLGDRYLGDDLSPAAVAKAVRQGHADFVKLVEAEVGRRTTSKVEQAARVPSSPAGGGAPAAEPEAEAQSVKEAIARARKRLLG